MKAIGSIVLSLFAIGAQADVVACVNASRTEAAAYSADKMTIDFTVLNSTGIPTPIPEAIVGEPVQVNPKEEYTAVFAYNLANGMTMLITWDAGQSEVLRNIRTNAIKMELKSAAGELIETYTNCRWEAQ